MCFCDIFIKLIKSTVFKYCNSSVNHFKFKTQFGPYEFNFIKIPLGIKCKIFIAIHKYSMSCIIIPPSTNKIIMTGFS